MWQMRAYTLCHLWKEFFMNTVLYNKLLISLLCVTLAFSLYTSVSIPLVSSILLGVTISCLNSYFSNNKFTLVSFTIYFIFSFYFPAFFVLVPLLLYDAPHLPKNERTFLYCITVLLFFLNGYNFSLSGMLLLIYAFLSLLLSKQQIAYRKLMDSYKKNRDEITEYNLILSKKNEALLEKQDYEIHVATLKERNRIAREIHDNVGHMLSRSLLQLGAILAIYKDEAIREHLLALKNTLNEAMDNIRNSVHDLHDSSMDLEENIHAILKDFQNYHISFLYDASDNLPKNIKYFIATIIKEALSNVVKHSNADSISIVVREHPSFCQVQIQDNGTNISIKDSGMGLNSMKERIDSLSGFLKIDTSKGFQIFFSIPL